MSRKSIKEIVNPWLRIAGVQLVSTQTYDRMTSPRSIYSDAWDGYVRTFASDDDSLEWAGDEWGTEDRWQAIFDDLFVARLPRDAKNFVEIGAGSGKYTRYVLDHYRDSTVHCFDVSEEFTRLLERRLADAIDANRVVPHMLDLNPYTMRDTIRDVGLMGRVDAVYSMDAMVHVDLQYLIAYLLTAADALTLGGHLILTLADATTDMGFAKLVGDVRETFPRQAGVSWKFEWLSPDLIANVLDRIGFEAPVFTDQNTSRDMGFSARLARRVDIEW